MRLTWANGTTQPGKQPGLLGVNKHIGTQSSSSSSTERVTQIDTNRICLYVCSVVFVRRKGRSLCRIVASPSGCRPTHPGGVVPVLDRMVVWKGRPSESIRYALWFSFEFQKRKRWPRPATHRRLPLLAVSNSQSDKTSSNEVDIDDEGVTKTLESDSNTSASSSSSSSDPVELLSSDLPR